MNHRKKGLFLKVYQMGYAFRGTLFAAFVISMIMAPMLDTSTIKKNCDTSNGAISNKAANGGIKIDATITAKESRTAITRYLFLKMPIFATGYIVERQDNA